MAPLVYEVELACEQARDHSIFWALRAEKNEQLSDSSLSNMDEGVGWLEFLHERDPSERQIVVRHSVPILEIIAVLGKQDLQKIHGACGRSRGE